MKHPGAFAPRYPQCTTDIEGIRRCNDCSERCSTCEQYTADDRSFATNINVCGECYNESLKRMCKICAVYTGFKKLQFRFMEISYGACRKIVVLGLPQVGLQQRQTIRLKGLSLHWWSRLWSLGFPRSTSWGLKPTSYKCKSVDL